MTDVAVLLVVKFGAVRWLFTVVVVLTVNANSVRGSPCKWADLPSKVVEE